MPYGMACPASGPVKKKLWSSTWTGSPAGRHSRPALTPDPALRERGLPCFELEHPSADSCLADPRHPSNSPHTAMPQQPGLSRQQQPPLPLVQMRQQHLEPQQELIAGLSTDAHTTRSNHQYEDNTLFLYDFSESGTAATRRRAGSR